MAAILDHVARTQPTREVTIVHADRNPERHPLRLDMHSHGSRLTSFTAVVWYEEASDVPGANQGFIDTDSIPLDPGADVYLCGPVPFMQAVRAGLHRRGVNDEQIRYEVFGSEQWRSTPVPATV